MGNMTIATTFIVFINVFLWLSSIVMLSINPAGSVCYNPEGSIIGQSVDLGTYSYNQSVLNNNVIDDLPSGEGTVVSGSSSVFTDIFNNILSWFKSTPGIKYVYGVVASPYNILKCTGLSNEFVVGLGTFWYLVSFLVLIAFLWGREQ